MKKYIYTLLILLVVTANGLFAKDAVVEDSFKNIKKIRIKLITGDCVIEKSKDSKVYVKVEHDYAADEFEIEMKKRNGRLFLEEDILVENSHGSSRWSLRIPDHLEIDLKSATGDFTIKKLKMDMDANTGTGNININDCDGELDVNTGTGNIKYINSTGDLKANTGTGRVIIADSNGDFELNSGTGKVEVKNCEGDISANSGTGKVMAEKITILNDGDFNSGTGQAIVIAPSGHDFKLSVNSGTSNAIVDMGQLPLDGFYELKAHNRRGKIISNVKFDDERLINSNGDEYIIKTVKRGKGANRYYISTGTGKAKLIE